MDITLNKMQLDISKEVRRFLEKECPIEYAREMYDNERGYRDDIWAKMVEMDWMAIRIPEPFGGMGMDQMDINMVLEEMGRTARSSRVLPTHSRMATGSTTFWNPSLIR